MRIKLASALGAALLVLAGVGHSSPALGQVIVTPIVEGPNDPVLARALEIVRSRR